LRRLPEILNTIGILPDEPRLEMGFQCGNDGSSLVFVIGAANAIKARLACDDLEENPTVAASSAGRDDLYVFDGEPGQAVCAAGDLLRPCRSEDSCAGESTN
jgi:hypothetical protein